MSQRNSDADSNPSGVPRGTSVFREPEVWIVFPVERVAAEIEQPNASMPWVQDQKTVPRGTVMWPKMLCASPCVRGALCSMWNNVEPDRYKICTRIFLFHVKQLAPQLGLC